MEDDACAVILNPLLHIGNDVRGEFIEVHPAQFVALVRFGVGGFSLPSSDVDKEIDTFLLLHTMNDGGEDISSASRRRPVSSAASRAAAAMTVSPPSR